MAELDATAAVRQMLEAEERLARQWCGSSEAPAVEVLREAIARERAEGCEEIALKYSVSAPHLRVLFVALCRRYGLTAFRRAGQRKSTFMAEGPSRFMHDVWTPLFEACADAVISRVTDWMGAVVTELDDHGGVAAR